MTTSQLLNSTTLRPGLLVSLKTSAHGGVSYQKQEIEPEHVTEEGVQKAKWETTRRIDDPVEHKRATEVRGKVGATIRKVCAQSAFGLLCPESNADLLTDAIKEARALCDEFNSSAKITRVSMNVLTGRIAPDDVEAVKAINSEIKDLMDAMAEGIERLDVKQVREAANRVKQVANVLTPEAQARVTLAVEAAREAAKKIVKAGEQAAVEIDRAAIRKVRDQRVAFVDMDEAKEVATPAAVTRTVDFEPVGEVKQPKRAAAPQIEV